MADGYPKVSSSAWRTLRSRAASAPSTKFTPSSVAAMLGLANPDSARTNIVGPLRRMGLIDEDGALTPLGRKWRVDASYAEACQDIVDAHYPADLAGLTAADGTPDAAQVKTWLEHKGFGDSNARQMAATYAMIASKQLPDGAVSESKKAPSKRSVTQAPEPNSAVTADPKRATPRGDISREGDRTRRSNLGPTVHLDIQIHLAADLSAEQIDQVFASMAKHLYGRDDEQ
jgi:hypothetical protein